MSQLLAVPAPPHAPGTELSPGYRVVAHLARGNRLDVYDGWSSERHSRCVLKTLRPDRAADGGARRALIREGQLLSRFTHPHLVRAYELTTASHDGRPVVVLETLDGETLAHLLHRLIASGRRLPLVDAVMLGSQLASVVTYLHRKGWLHLDLKPDNVVASGGRAKLLDLSIARRPGKARAGTGTFDYLSPEQARGGVLTTAADVWGLGAVLYTALAGRPPYGRVSEAAGSWSDGDDDVSREDAAALSSDATTAADGLDYPQLVEDPMPVGRHRRVPAKLAAIVDACLARDPTARPTLAKVATVLDGWLASQPGQGAGR